MNEHQVIAMLSAEVNNLRGALLAVVEEVELEHPPYDCECGIADAMDRARAALASNGGSA